MKQFSSYSIAQSRPESTAYEGLETMRVISSFAVVFLHVCAATGLPGSLEWFMKFRDFALPTMVMSSFFVLTVSLVRKPEKDFGQFFSRRFTRLWIPLFIWTLFYTLFIIFLVPFLMGFEPAVEDFSPVVFLTGYRHLWYLQFIFIGSLVVYPVISKVLLNRRVSRAKLFLFCALGAICYEVLYWVIIWNPPWQPFAPETDINLQIFAAQTSRYFLYIPAAVGLGLMSDKIDKLFQHEFFRKASLAAAGIAMVLHVGTNAIPATQELFGIAVFLAALQPWKKISSDFWQKLVAYSYGVYILHFFLVHLLWIIMAHYTPVIGGAAVLFAALIVYFLSFSAAVLIRKIFPADWLLPLIRKGHQPRPHSPSHLYSSAVPAE